LVCVVIPYSLQNLGCERYKIITFWNLIKIE
jgi:hypothetical protein